MKEFLKLGKYQRIMVHSPERVLGKKWVQPTGKEKMRRRRGRHDRCNYKPIQIYTKIGANVQNIKTKL